MPGKQVMLRRSTNRGRCSTQVISGEKITSPQGRAREGPWPPRPRELREQHSTSPSTGTDDAQLNSSLLRSWIRALGSSGSWEKSEEEEEAFGLAMGAQNWRDGRRLRRGMGARITSCSQVWKIQIIVGP